MRLDKYLKVSRIIKRRTVANEACSMGRVTVNDKVAKPAADVNPGDIISVRMGAKRLTAEVLAVRETVRKEEADSMYRIIEDSLNTDADCHRSRKRPETAWIKLQYPQFCLRPVHHREWAKTKC